MKGKRWMAAMAAWAGLFATGAQAAAVTQDHCVAPEDAAGLIQAMLPGMLKGMATTCQGTLPSGAFLLNQPAGFTEKYQIAAQAAAPRAMSAIREISGTDLSGMDPAMVMPMVQSMAEPMLGGLIKPEDCPGTNRIIELLAPLPPQNLGALVVTILQMKGEDEGDKLPICPMEQ